MDIFLLLAINILPLYILIALGYVSGRWLDVNLPSMTTIAIYILAPVVNFGAIAQMQFDANYVVLMLAIMLGSIIIGSVNYRLAQHAWKNDSANLIGMGSISGNTMYFGLPIVLTLFGAEWLGVYVLMNLGNQIVMDSLGYYYGARGQADIKGALLKVAKMPLIYAIALGLVANLVRLPLPDLFLRYWHYATGAWVLMGMMLIGVALAKQAKLAIDWRLMAWLFAPKFLAWPAFGAAVIALDLALTQTFTLPVQQMIMIFCSVPLAGNLVAFAANLNLHPERAASTVLLSTLLALFTIPCTLLLFAWFMGH